VDGRAQPAGRPGPEGAAPLKPGARLARHSGASPFNVGAAGGGAVCDMALHGMNISAGLKYRSPSPTEVRLDGKPVDDGRYTERSLATVAFLPMDDAPATHVRVGTSGLEGVGYWIPARLGPPSYGLATRDMTLWSDLQSAMAIGYVFGETLTDDNFYGGMRGLTSIRVGPTYPVVMDRCTVSGWDCGLFAFQWILSATNTSFGIIGRDGVRCQGGTFVWRNSLFGGAEPNNETLFKFMGNAYGNDVVIDGVLADDEGSPPSVCAIQVEAAPYVPNLVEIRRVAMGTAPPVFVRLIGHKAAGAIYQDGKVTVSGLSRYDGKTGAAVEVVGPRWYGTIDAQGLDTNRVTGDTKDLKVSP
jgi:hypothetical protein